VVAGLQGAQLGLRVYYGGAWGLVLLEVGSFAARCEVLQSVGGDVVAVILGGPRREVTHLPG
jgi:hypothetical protein